MQLTSLSCLGGFQLPQPSDCHSPAPRHCPEPPSLPSIRIVLHCLKRLENTHQKTRKACMQRDLKDRAPCAWAAQQPGLLAHGLRWVEGRRPERASCLGGDGFRMMLRHAMKNAKRGCAGWRLRGGEECWDVGVQLNMKAHSRGKSGEADH